MLGAVWVLQELFTVHVCLSKLLSSGHYLQHFQLPSVNTRVYSETIKNNNTYISSRGLIFRLIYDWIYICSSS
jgi:hypothetical protein